MKQLALALAPAPAPSLENFVVGRNGEVLDSLLRLSRGEESEHIVYLWGPPGSGKTHLLRALASAHRLPYATDCLAEMQPPLAVDDVHRLDVIDQTHLFRLALAALDQGTVLLAAGDVPPAQLNLRADVATRLGSGLVYQVHILSDEEKAVALQSYAAGRGLDLKRELIQYLLTHGSRDLRVLLTVVDALDRFSLEAKRPVTLPLLRDVLRETDVTA